jgi:hypothetical protein
MSVNDNQNFVVNEVVFCLLRGIVDVWLDSSLGIIKV